MGRQGGGRIAVRVRPEGEAANVEVADTGPGIPDELVDKVFDLFVQGDRRSIALSGSAIVSSASSPSCTASRRARRRRKSSEALWAMWNSQPSALASGPVCGKASIALISVSCSTSSPSITEPVMRAQ